MLTASDLVYNEEQHTTQTRDGRSVPHVTTILSAVGVSTDFDVLARVANVDVELARARGRAVHADCHSHDDNDLDIDRVDARVLPYLDAWVQFRADTGLQPLQRERAVFHYPLWYTGILDGVFSRGPRNDDGTTVLVDIKTGDPEDAAAHLQTAAYEAAWLMANPKANIDARWAVWLRPDKRIPYTIVNYTERANEHEDFGKFMACLTVFNEQPMRRMRVR